MIPVTTAVLVTSGISITVALAGFVIGREDRRRLSRLRAVWRAEVATELHAKHQAALLIAEQRGAARVREAYDAEAATDRMVREARAEITDLRDQLGYSHLTIRCAQDLAMAAGPGGSVSAERLERVLDGDRTDAPEVVA